MRWHAFLVLVLPCSAFGATLSGRVSAVPSGDMLVVATAHGAVRVRIAGVDAPMSDQPFGAEAREFLERHCLHKEVAVEAAARDARGTPLGKVKLGRQDIAALLVSRGFAWALGGSARHLRRLQAEARTARRGLWGDGTPFPPWEWQAARKRLERLAASQVLPVTADRVHHVFYPPGCPVPSDLVGTNRALFRTVRQAEAAGYLRSPACKAP